MCYQSFPKSRILSHLKEYTQHRSLDIPDEVQQQLRQQSHQQPQQQTISGNSQTVDTHFTENQQEIELTGDESHDWDMFEIADVEENTFLEIASMEDVISTEEVTSTQAICRKLNEFKNSIENPIHITIDDHAQTYLDSLSHSRKASLDFKSLLKEKAGPKSTTKELFNFYNGYLKETNNGKLNIIIYQEKLVSCVLIH